MWRTEPKKDLGRNISEQGEMGAWCKGSVDHLSVVSGKLRKSSGC